MDKRIAALTVICMTVGSTQVSAQSSNPSTDQIIHGLTPSPLTRGIHRLAPSETASQTPADAPSVSITVNFASGSADLTPEAIQALDGLGAALSSDTLARYHFRVEGHTDTVGTPDANRALSRRRADAVVAYITKKFSVAPARLQPVGMGSDGMLIPTAAQVPEARNRRVKVVNIGG